MISIICLTILFSIFPLMPVAQLTCIKATCFFAKTKKPRDFTELYLDA